MPAVSLRVCDSARMIYSFDMGALVLPLTLCPLPGLDDKHPVTGKTALHEAVTMNSLSVARVLLSAGASPNLGHVSQGPPLLSAAAFGEVELVELLLAAGANVTAVDIAG